MPSYQITIAPSRRAAVRYIDQVRRALLRAFSAEAAAGLTQAEIAKRIGVNRSVIHRELRGEANLTQGRVGELAWAMGYEPVFELKKLGQDAAANDHHPVVAQNVRVMPTGVTAGSRPLNVSTTSATPGAPLTFSVQG